MGIQSVGALQQTASNASFTGLAGRVANGSGSIADLRAARDSQDLTVADVISSRAAEAQASFAQRGRTISDVAQANIGLERTKRFDVERQTTPLRPNLTTVSISELSAPAPEAPQASAPEAESAPSRSVANPQGADADVVDVASNAL